ncbi:MAG: hypothetical protein OHK0053_24970 [Microscillaceae bacterium]
MLNVPGYGQSTRVRLVGEIRDSIAKPLGFANVIVQRAVNNRVVVFGISNEAGQFDLQFLADTSAYTLIITMLGYGPEKIPLLIDLQQSDQSIEKKVVLKEQSLDLKTVVIEAELPVSQNGDTTRYAVESLTSGSEQNLEAILRKLPGVEVAPDGTVSVNGKQIKSLLIEGEDLFNDQYQLGTKNIPANMIAGVEAIDHYEGDDLMRGVRHSEDMVLNIVLKKKKVNYWLGETEGGYGPENRRTAKVNTFWLNPRHKWYLLGQHNNLGFHPVGLAQAQGEEQIGELMAPDPWLYRLALPTLPINETLLQDRQANLNEAYLGYWGGVDKIGSRFRMQHFTYAYVDHFPRTQQLENAYRQGRESFVLTENRQQRSLPWQLQGRQKMSLALNQHTRLDLLTQQEVGSLRHETHLQTMVSPDLGGFLNENLSEDSEAQTILLHQQLCLTQRLDSGWAWKAQVYSTHEERPEYYALSSPRWADFFGLRPEFSKLYQDLFPDRRTWGAQALLLGNIHHISLEAELAFRHQTSRITRNLSLQAPEASADSVFTPLSNALDENLFTLRLMANQKIGKKMNLSATLELMLPSQTFMNQDKTPKSLSQPFLAPAIQASYTLKNGQILFLGYQYQQSRPQLSEIQDFSHFADYRSLRAGADSLIFPKNHLLFLGYILLNFKKSFNFQTFLNYYDREQPYGFSNVFQPIFSEFRYFPVPVNRFLSHTLKMSKFLQKTSLSLFFESRLSRGMQDMIQNDVLLRNQIFKGDYSLGFFSLWDKGLNLEWKGQFIQNKFRNAFTTNGWTSTFIIRIQAKLIGDWGKEKAWKAELVYEFLQFQDNAQKSQNYPFFNLSLGYQPKEKKWGVFLEGYNLFNEQVFRQENLGDNSTQRVEQGILPRIMLFKCRYQF